VVVQATSEEEALPLAATNMFYDLKIYFKILENWLKPMEVWGWGC
jgi:hypothetical protein